jgi:signal transduction histidine kinase/ligand-binding sensor domain-containing protein
MDQNCAIQVSCMAERWISGHLKTAILVLTLLIAFYSSFAQAGKMSFKNLTPEMGLSHGDVLSIYQDHEGYMWIGTVDGLNRYDGVTFTVYKNNPKDSTSLPNSCIICIYEDKKNNLWIGTATSDGLCRYNRETDNFERIRYTDEQNGKLENIVTTMLDDNTGQLWVCTSNGVFWFDPAKNIFHQCFTETYGKDILVNFNEIHKDKDGTLWFISEDQVNGGIIKYNPVTKETDRYNTQHPIFKLKENAVYSFLIDKQENIWIGGYSTGLTMIDQHSKTIINYQNEPGNSNSLSSNYIPTLEQTDDGKILIGTESGFNVFDPYTKTFDRYTATEADGSIVSNSIKKIYIGNDGIVWIGCWAGGISIYDKRFEKFTLYKHDKQTGYSFKIVTSFAEDLNGNIWIASDGRGITWFNPKEKKFVRYLSNVNDPKTLTNDKVLAVETDDKGGLWVGMWQGGLNYFQIKDSKLILKKKYPRVDETDPKSNSVFRIYRNKAGEIWVGNFETGAYLFDPKTERFKRMFSLKELDTEVKAGSAIIDILSDSQGDVWFATLGRGLIKLNRNTGKYEHFTHNEHDSTSICNNNPNVIFEDSEKRLWIGSSCLNLYNRETSTFTNYTTAQGLTDNTIAGILEDNHHNLWISTNNGISKATIDTTKEKIELTFRNYSTFDGLQNKIFNKWAFLKSKSGEMYFGGINGFNVFQPDSIKDNPYLPPVHLTDFLLFNKPVPIGTKNSPLKKHISQTQKIVLKHDQSVFTFRFIALNYIFSEKSQYAYKMDGFEKDWNYVGNKREATYTNLDPGDYTFHVKASNNDGVWNEQGTSVIITILPPWWGTWWFRGSALVLVLSLIYAGFLFRVRNIKKHNLRLESEVAERTHQLQVAMNELEAFSYSVSHDLRAPLRSIDGFSQVLLEEYQEKIDDQGKNYLQRVRFASQRMAQLIDDMLTLSKVSRSEMNFRKVNLSKMVHDISEELTDNQPERKSKFIIKEGIIVQGDDHLLRIVLENLLENAWKFTSKKPAALIEFGVEFQKDIPVYFIRDNGAGFNMDYIQKMFGAFQRLHSSDEFQGTGIGLATVQRIIRRHGGKVWAEGEVEKGATFYFTIPSTIGGRS